MEIVGSINPLKLVPTNYCPRCTKKVRDEDRKYCRGCQSQMRREVNFMYNNHSWPIAWQRKGKRKKT